MRSCWTMAVSVVVFSLAISFYPSHASADEAAPTTAPAKRRSPRAELLDRLRTDLQSKDAAVVSAALDQIASMPPKSEDLVKMLLDSHHYAEAEALAIRVMIASADNLSAVENSAKYRAQALLDEGKAAEALSAARTYYN